VRQYVLPSCQHRSVYLPKAIAGSSNILQSDLQNAGIINGICKMTSLTLRHVCAPFYSYKESTWRLRLYSLWPMASTSMAETGRHITTASLWRPMAPPILVVLLRCIYFVQGLEFKRAYVLIEQHIIVENEPLVCIAASHERGCKRWKQRPIVSHPCVIYSRLWQKIGSIVGR
jgi:hypothetical protein